MEHILKGFLFSLGCLPVAILLLWISKYFSPVNDAIYDDSIAEADLSFDKDSLDIGELKIVEKGNGLIVMGTLDNESSESCSFIQLDGDLFIGDKLLAHGMGVVQNLDGGQSRGFEIYFDGSVASQKLENLTAQVSISHAWNIDL